MSPLSKACRPVVLALLFCALTACSSGFDGRYGSLDRNGEIRTDSAGEPSAVLTVDGEAASLRIGNDSTTYQVKVIDDKLHLVPDNGNGPTIVLRKEGDQLVTEGGGRENRLARL